MRNTNSAIVENFERGGSYGQPESELLYALRTNGTFVVLRIVSHAASLWSMLVSLFFWRPLLWSLILYPAFVILSLVLRNFIDMSHSTMNMYAVLLTYVTGVWLSLRRKTPVQDYRTRKQYVGSKTLSLDFAQHLMVAEEIYRYTPERNRVLTIAFEDMFAWVVWHQVNQEFVDDDIYLDSFSIHIRLKRANDINMAWAQNKIDEPILYHQYDKDDAAQNAAARQKFDEVMALLSAHQILQK